MPSSYVCLAGHVALDAAVGSGGKIRLFFSDNNGLDWQEVASVETAGRKQIDLQSLFCGGTIIGCGLY